MGLNKMIDCEINKSQDHGRDNNITYLLGLSFWTNTLNNVMIILHVYWVCQFGQTR
jgi:hypothetical protein